jgi:hypothetical protein
LRRGSFCLKSAIERANASAEREAETAAEKTRRQKSTRRQCRENNNIRSGTGESLRAERGGDEKDYRSIADRDLLYLLAGCFFPERMAMFGAKLKPAWIAKPT